MGEDVEEERGSFGRGEEGEEGGRRERGWRRGRGVRGGRKRRWEGRVRGWFVGGWQGGGRERTFVVREGGMVAGEGPFSYISLKSLSSAAGLSFSFRARSFSTVFTSVWPFSFPPVWCVHMSCLLFSLLLPSLHTVFPVVCITARCIQPHLAQTRIIDPLFLAAWQVA